MLFIQKEKIVHATMWNGENIEDVLLLAEAPDNHIIYGISEKVDIWIGEERLELPKGHYLIKAADGKLSVMEPHAFSQNYVQQHSFNRESLF